MFSVCCEVVGQGALETYEHLRENKSSSIGDCAARGYVFDFKLLSLVSLPEKRTAVQLRYGSAWP